MAKCICPNCKSENIIPIMYGYPAPEAMEAAVAGELKLGGCEVYIDGCDMPDKFCKDCEFAQPGLCDAVRHGLHPQGWRHVPAQLPVDR